MKRFSISKQIAVIAISPVLFVATVLATYHTLSQLDYISQSLVRNGNLIVKQLAPAAEYAVYSGNTELIKPLIKTVISNNPVVRVQIRDKHKKSILDIKAPNPSSEKSRSFLQRLITDQKKLDFSAPIVTEDISVEDNETLLTLPSTNSNNVIGTVVVTISTHEATKDKTHQIIYSSTITLLTVILTIFIIIRLSNSITQPIKSLTQTVKNIASGNLDVRMNKNATGEIGDLQSGINHMASELKHYQSDMENQLDEYTNELQQTMEELELRNAELDITRSKAINASKAKSEFLANMSHEIRTPLSGIIGFTELLKDTTLNSQQKDYTNTIDKSANILLEIINDILDLAKIESGKTEINTSEFNLIDIIEDIINLLSPTALEKDIELFYSIDNNVPEVINSDPFRIHQVLTNLISNAIKFTDKGYVYLQVNAEKPDLNEANIKFTVIDTGIGMNNEEKNKLFTAFTQADTSITRRFGGTGLGLVISKKLTQLMNGKIDFDSVKGKGSTFWFSIPVSYVMQEKPESGLAARNIAFISNNIIASKAFKTLLQNFECRVDNYPVDAVKELAEIESSNDAIVLFLGRKEINDESIIKIISKINLSRPSLLIASTRSHTELRDLQQNIFDDAAFTSEKIKLIKRKLHNIIHKSDKKLKPDNAEHDMTDASDWSNINILIVDDNEVNLRLAEIILHKHNANITTARSGAQAIDYAGIHHYDIIFMDLHMPGIDGYETAKSIREASTHKQPVIIAVTANALPHEKEKVTLSGMNGILIKPVSDTVMQNVIKQWVLNKSIHTHDDDISNDNENPGPEEIFSIDLAKQFTGNNEKLAYELFEMFRAELADYITSINTSVSTNNLKQLGEVVHKLHGASRCCGTAVLQQRCEHLENLIVQQADFDVREEARQLLAAIDQVAHYKK
jgi:two-component system sensor histidine kinase BarA